MPVAGRSRSRSRSRSAEGRPGGGAVPRDADVPDRHSVGDRQGGGAEPTDGASGGADVPPDEGGPLHWQDDDPEWASTKRYRAM